MKAKSIRNRIHSKGPGWIFSASDFADLIDRNSTDQTLFRLSKKGAIRKLTTGLYDVPVINKRFGHIPPDPDKIARALAKKFDSSLQIHPARAAYSLGLTQQVPTQPVYLTDGLSKNVKVGRQTIKFVHAAPKKMIGIDTTAGLVIQALYYFGKNNINADSFISTIRSQLTPDDLSDIINLIHSTPLWMQPILRQIVNSGSTTNDSSAKLQKGFSK